MGIEIESVWQAMKNSHYKRISERMSQDIRKASSLDAALKTALEAVVTGIHAETGTLWLYDKATNRLHPKCVYKGADLTGVSLRPGEGIAGKVMESCESVIIRDCQADPRWAGRVDEKTGFQTKTMICVPLPMHQIAYGSVQIINNRDGSLFDELDLALAQQLVTQITPLLQEKDLMPEMPTLPQRKEVTLRELLLARNVETALNGLPEYLQLTVRRQQEVAKLCRELQKCFPRKDW